VLAYLAGHADGGRSRLKLDLVVVRTADLERSREFYTRLGLRLVPEQHGSGPHHYACTLADAVLELYPATNRSPATGGLRLGLQVPDAAAAIEGLLAGGFLQERPSVARVEGAASVYVVRDPDGNAVELRFIDPEPARHDAKPCEWPANVSDPR